MKSSPTCKRPILAGLLPKMVIPDGAFPNHHHLVLLRFQRDDRSRTMGLNVIVRLLQLGLCLYVLVAVLFTTWVYVLSPVAGFFRSRAHALSAPSNSAPGRNGAAENSVRLSQDPLEMRLDLGLADTLENSDWAHSWASGYASSDLSYLSHARGSMGKTMAAGGLSIRDETLLSKAFSEAMHPMRIIPFYFKSSNDIDPDDVTITTLVTSNRFRVFQQLVERYRGPISVTIHIPLPLHATFSSLKPNHPSRLALSNLHALYASSSLFSQFVDVHLAFSPFTSALSADPVVQTEGEGGRQFNVWRNVARLFARTNFVMMLDVDFAVCTDWRGSVRDAIREAASPSPIGPPFRTERKDESIRATDAAGANPTEIVGRLREGTAALVVPAFEYVKQPDGIDQRTFPTDKQVCRQSVSFSSLQLGSISVSSNLNCSLTNGYCRTTPRRAFLSWHELVHLS